jgi:hypothetical protein
MVIRPLRVPVSNCHSGPLLIALDLGHMIIPESWGDTFVGEPTQNESFTCQLEAKRQSMYQFYCMRLHRPSLKLEDLGQKVKASMRVSRIMQLHLIKGTDSLVACRQELQRWYHSGQCRRWWDGPHCTASAVQGYSDQAPWKPTVSVNT